MKRVNEPNQLCILEIRKADAIKNFNRLVLNRNKLEPYLRTVIAQDLNILLDDIRFWGVDSKKGNMRVFERISENTTIIAILNKEVKYKIEVIGTKKAPLFPVVAGWGLDYSNVILLKKPQPISIPYQLLRRALSYKNGHWSGLKSVGNDTLRKSLLKMGVRNLDEWIDTLSENKTIF